MKIALLCRRIDERPTNGFERYAHNLFHGLSAQGQEVILPNQNGKLPIPPSASLLSPPYFDVYLPFKEIALGRMDADVYHAVTDSEAVIFPWLKGRKIVTMHHVEVIPPENPIQGVYRSFYEMGTSIALKYADHVICISKQTRREVMQELDVSEDRTTVIPQSIPSFFRPLGGNGSNIVGYLGAFKKRKNVDFLIRAFAILQEKDAPPGCKLHLYGDGPDRGRLVKTVDDLNLNEKVLFMGKVREEDIVKVYNSFGVFGFPSIQEGFGFPIMEAQACGVPVVYLKGALMPEESVKCAVPCKDEEEMAMSILRLLTEEKLRSKVVQDGLDYVSHFTLENMAKSTLDVYEKVLGNR